MAASRQALSEAHPAKTNVLSVGIINVLILIVSLQIWLLSASLNTSLSGHGNIAWTSFYGSLALFIAGTVALRYLPLPIRLPEVVKRVEPFVNAALAWRTLGISAVSLALAFAVWFMWSAIAIKLNDAGFGLTKNQLFWLTATPVILGSLLRIPYGLIVSRFGSRISYAAVTLLLLLPPLGTGFAVQNPKTPYWVLLFWSAVTGIAGANFATSMATVTLWFPKQLQGSALGINGLGNLGVTVAQFTIPLVIGFSLAGAAEPSTAAALRPIHLGNAAFVWVPIILVCTAAIWFGTRDYPAQPQSLASQLVAGKRLHTWVLSTLYFLTFGCFVAMGASLPLIIKEVFAKAPGGAPNPLLFAPWAAAIATLMRPAGGWLADKFGAGLITSISIATMALGGFSLSATGGIRRIFCRSPGHLRGLGTRQRQRLQDHPTCPFKRGGGRYWHCQLPRSTWRLRSATSAGMDDGFVWQPCVGLHGHGSICSTVPGYKRLFLSPAQLTQSLLKIGPLENVTILIRFIAD
jgi:nitrate/nitrite transporter NarK